MSSSLFLLVLSALTTGLSAQYVPSWPATYSMNASTIVMHCNYSGLIDPATMSSWALQDVDWSNGLQNWSYNVPMNTEELLTVQAHASASNRTRVWIYRNSVYAYPWYTGVRAILDDPAYESWFMKFKPQGPYYSPQCDTNYNPPLCSDFFHTQMDTPHPPGQKGYGTCPPPACNCGTKPCGFYLFDHAATTIVNGQSFQEWFVQSYVFDAAGRDPAVSGFFLDDFFSETGDMGDNTPNATEDMGLTPADLAQLTASYDANMAALRNYTLAQGKFTWQMLWTGGPAGGRGNTCPGPIVGATPETCAADLAEYCAPGSTPQTTAMMYAFSPGGCDADPSNLTALNTDIVNFLLLRGDYAWIGHGWKGCSRHYVFPPELNLDYGTPLGLCAETAPGSGVFTREWTKATVQMDCNTLTPTITFKTGDGEGY